MANNRKVGTGRAAATEADDVTIVNPETGAGMGTAASPFQMAVDSVTAAALAAVETNTDRAADALEAAASTVSVAADTSIMRNGQTDLTPKFAVISASTSGDNTIVAAVTAKKIRVLAYNFISAGAVNVRFQTAAAGAYLTGLKTIDAASKGICAPYNPVGWFETVAGDLLNLELSGAVLVGGELVYIEV